MVGYRITKRTSLKVRAHSEEGCERECIIHKLLSLKILYMPKTNFKNISKELKSY